MNPDETIDPEAATSWDSEISDRIEAIDQGRVVGVSYEDVMKNAEERLSEK